MIFLLNRHFTIGPASTFSMKLFLFLCFYCLRALFGGLFDDHGTIYGQACSIKTIDHISCSAQYLTRIEMYQMKWRELSCSILLCPVCVAAFAQLSATSRCDYYLLIILNVIFVSNKFDFLCFNKIIFERMATVGKAPVFLRWKGR